MRSQRKAPYFFYQGDFQDFQAYVAADDSVRLY